MKHQKILSILQKEISSLYTKERFRKSVQFFTRNRILTFGTLVNMRLNMMNKSISVELSKFLSRFLKKKASKQAFSKAIKQIKWEGFRYFNDFLIKQYYSDQEYKKFKDIYLVMATDGTTYELPYEPALVEYFGEYSNKMMQPKCMAQGLKLYDVLNHLTISSVCSRYNEKDTKQYSEQALFRKEIERIEEFIDFKAHQVLLLGDKYYPSFYHLDELPRRGINFVFRCKAHFCTEVKEFAQTNQQEALLTLDMKQGQRPKSRGAKAFKQYPDEIKIRCLRIEHSKGKPFFFLTNLSPAQLSYEQVGQVYNLRWGEEVSFDTDKNIIEIENFSSKTPNGVLQEFFAKTLTLNMTELLVADAQKKLNQEQAQKNNKHQYKINKAVTIGLVKDEIIPFLDGTEPISKWYPRMINLIVQHRCPVRKNRSSNRKRKHKTKFSMNKRRPT